MRNYLLKIKNCVAKMKLFLAKNSYLTAIFIFLALLVFILYGWKTLLIVLLLLAWVVWFIGDIKKSQDRRWCEFCHKVFDANKLKMVKNGKNKKLGCPKCLKRAVKQRGYELAKSY